MGWAYFEGGHNYYWEVMVIHFAQSLMLNGCVGGIRKCSVWVLGHML